MADARPPARPADLPTAGAGDAGDRGTEPRGLRRDAAENRRRLLLAAQSVFARRGLDAGVEEIAQAAGVGVGTLYRRFPTKDALISELVRELLTEVVAMAGQAQDVPDGRGLETYCYAMGRLQIANRGCLARVWVDEASTGLHEQYRASLAALLADAQAHGTIRPDASVTDLDLLFWSMRGIIETTGDVSSTAWRRQVAISLAGLRPGAQALDEVAVDAEVVARVRDAAVGR